MTEVGKLSCSLKVLSEVDEFKLISSCHWIWKVSLNSKISSDVGYGNVNGTDSVLQNDSVW